MSKTGPSVKWRGVNFHRYHDNPLEAVVAKAWEAFNTPSSGFCHLDFLLDNKGSMAPKPATPHERAVASTVIQWLGSPVGLNWLAETIGAEVAQEHALNVQHKRAVGRCVKVGQTYQSQDKRDEGRRIVVIGTRYAPGDALYKTGARCMWRCRNADTGKMSYIREDRLLDQAQWVPV